MNKKQRIQILKESQNAPAAPVQPATTTTPTVTQTTINLRQLPNFNANLFANRPDLINDINNIVNIINKYLLTLSGNKINFNMVWSSPSVTGSEFTNSVKNLLNLAKWIYNVVKSRARAYSIEGLRAIGNGLLATVRSYSFPEPESATVQNELITAGQNILAKLGPAH